MARLDTPKFIRRSTVSGNHGKSMPNPLPPALLLMLAAPVPQAVPDDAIDGVELAQLIIRQRIVIRMAQPMASRAPIPLPPTPDYQVIEKKGPKCIPIDKLAGSGVARKDSVDLLMSDGTLLRARLGDDCPALDFYSGVYVKQTADGKICGDRDVIRARSGRACPIDSFRKLKAKK